MVKFYPDDKDLANLTLDDAMKFIVLPCNPLGGPIMMDYLNQGKFNMGLVDQSYNDDLNHFRAPRSMNDSINSFWRLVKTWVTPTCDEVYSWIRELCKHIIVLHELFEFDLGPVRDPPYIMGSLALMNGFVEDYDTDEVTAAYKAVLEGDGPRSALEYLLTNVRTGKNRVDIRSANTEFLAVTYKHICGIVNQTLIPWHHQGKIDGPEREKGEGYQVRLYTDDQKQPVGGPDGTAFLQFPSCIFNKGLEEPRDNRVPIPETAFQVPSEPLAESMAEIVTAIMFYSGIDDYLPREVDTVVEAYVAGDTAYTDKKVHLQFGSWEAYLSKSKQTMERVNYEALRRIFAGTFETAVRAPDIEEDVALIGQALPAGLITSLQAGVRSSATQKKSDVVKKANGKNNTVFLLLAVGAAVAYAASS